MRKITTITTKLTRIYWVVAISILFVSGVISQLYLYQHARRVAHENLSTQAVALAGNLESAVAFGDEKFAQQTLDALRYQPDVMAAAVILADGSYLTRYSAAGQIQENNGQELLARGEYVDTETHGAVSPISLQGESPARLIVVGSLKKINQESLVIVLASTGIATCILLTAFIVFRRMSSSITRPIEELTALMRKVEREENQSYRTNIDTNDEIGELAKGFNGMLSALEQNNQRLSDELVERTSIQTKLDRLVNYDTVTHLPNRRYFHERLNLAVEHSLRLGSVMGVVFVDLDNFKLVNDTFGHHIGDQHLQVVAKRLSESLRTSDVVCRLGGDEFAIILENLTETHQIDQLLEKLIHNLSKPLKIEKHNLVVTGSIGIALCPEDSDSPEMLLRFADTAMYAAKGDGKNKWRRFSPEMASSTALRLTLESQMRVALDEGQFEVHYQPQIDLNSGLVCGIEALVRWNHPEQGFISPAQFIPVAEESGLIRPLGEWVLRTSCLMTRALSLNGHPDLMVAVNVSVRQLSHSSFAAEVFGILEETQLPAHQLTLEITESMLLQNGEKTLAMLRLLRDRGIGIAIDDFGTGYSSMSQLKNMPVTKLKIDKSFVDDIVTDSSDRAITAAMSNLAHNLNIQIIAEGVENKEQVALLRKSGCHEFQGYHFSRPLHENHLAGFIEQFNRNMPNVKIDKPLALVRVVGSISK